MICKSSRLSQFKQYTKLVLVLFVVSVLNMSFQIPAHATMQLNMQISQGAEMDHSNMNHESMQQMDMQSCECPPALCDQVDAQQDQLKQNIVPIASLDILNFYPIQVVTQVDATDLQAYLSLQYHDWHYRQIIPPPISLTTELQI